MKGQLFELMFYPYMAVLLLFFFSYQSFTVTSDISTTQNVLDASDKAISSSNMVLLNCTPDHFLKKCHYKRQKGKYYIRRLATDGITIKELIFPATE